MKRSVTILLVLAAILFFAGSEVYAQDYVFRVMAKKGEAMSATTANDWRPMRTGTSIYAGQQIQVGEDSYLGLVHKSGRTIEIKVAGVYKVDKLASDLNTSASSVAGKYADYVLAKVSASDEDINANHERYLSATGSVTRGPIVALRILLPASGTVYNNETLLQWNKLGDPNNPNPTYMVTFKNMYDEVVLEAETMDTTIVVDMDDESLVDERMIIVNVSIKGNESLGSKSYAIKRLDSESAEAIVEELDQLSEITSDPTAMNMLILASFYEQNDLLVDALFYYQQAISLAPDVDIFTTAYEEFIVAHELGMK